MPRKQYESYRYDDPDFEYTYPDDGTLRNKLEIHDQKLALEKEYQLSAERILELSMNPIAVRSIKDVRAIHRCIFQDMYVWACEYRKVNITKSGKSFMPRAAFETGEEYIDSLIATYHKTAVGKEAIAKQLAEILDALNHMHPFREGNGRCQREVILSLARERGYDLFLDVESDDDVYNRYIDGTVNGDIKILEGLFMDTLEPTDE